MKSLRMIGWLVLWALVFSAAVSAAGSGRIFGDVDSNGSVEIVDAAWIQRSSASVPIPFTVDLTASDIDGDGQLTLVDATLIQSWLEKISSDDRIGRVIGDPQQPTQDEYELPVQ